MRIRHPRISATNQAINHQGYPLNEVGKAWVLDGVCHSPIREGDEFPLHMSHMIQCRAVGTQPLEPPPAAISIVLFSRKRTFVFPFELEHRETSRAICVMLF